MKIKILMVPLAIVITIIFSIWMVYPAYTNGIDGVKEKYAELKEIKAKLSKLENEGNNMAGLSSQLASLPVEKAMLYKFIPENIKDEEIVDNLNFFASSLGLAVLEITIEQPKPERNLLIDPSLAEADKFGGEAPPTPLPLVQNFNAEVQLAGSYEKIREFIIVLNKLSRYNNISNLEVRKSNSGSGQIVSSDNLLASMSVNFGVLRKVDLSGNNATDPVFSTSQLDLKAVSEIRNKNTSETPKMNIEQKGKNNPFVL